MPSKKVKLVDQIDLKEVGTGEPGELLVSVPHMVKAYLNKPDFARLLEKTPAVSALNPADFDAIIIPGGFAPDYLRRSHAVLKIVRDCMEQGKIVATICHAGWVLASAGVLKGKTMTCLFSIKDDVINAGAKYVDQEVVRDGNLITSRLPDDLPVFLREIIGALK